MTKKARRRQIMECVGYPEKRITEHDTGFVYKREGELLKEELERVCDALGVEYDGENKQTLRRKLRDECEINRSYGRFSLHDLTGIWRELRSRELDGDTDD